MNPELPDDYHEQKARERNAALKWIGKAALLIVVLVLLDQWFNGAATIGGLFKSLVLFGFAMFFVRFMDAITGRSVKNKKD